MNVRRLLTVLLAAAFAPLYGVPVEWVTPIAPFRLSGDLYYVGSRDLAAYLVVTRKGNVLINSNLESSPALVRRSVQDLGFRWTDTKILLSSQAHYDHVAGAAEIIRETHARYMVMDGDVPVVESGGATDFDATLRHFPPAHVDRTLHDEDTVTLGEVTLTAHKTAGHTRGCTTWTMETKQGGRKLKVVIVGGWAPNPGVRLVAIQGRPASYPGIAADYDHAFAVLKQLPCDIFLGAHGSYFEMLAKLSRALKEGDSVWIDPQGYRNGVAEHEAAYRKQLALQKAGKIGTGE